jgi:hypothetical protein
MVSKLIVGAVLLVALAGLGTAGIVFYSDRCGETAMSPPSTPEQTHECRSGSAELAPDCCAPTPEAK